MKQNILPKVALLLLAAGILPTSVLLGQPQAPVAPPSKNPQQSDAQSSLVKVPDDVPRDAARYTVLVAGNKAGVIAMWTAADGARHSFFEFNDRGRGSITPGKLADVILVDCNPAARVSDIRRVVTVVKDGVVFDPAALYESLGVKPQ